MSLRWSLVLLVGARFTPPLPSEAEGAGPMKLLPSRFPIRIKRIGESATAGARTTGVV